MGGWLDRVAIAAANSSQQRVSRREALRATGQVTAAALAGAALTGAAATDALASSNGYCLTACLVANDNGFDHFVGHCKQDYLASSGTGVDAADLIDCIAEAHRALKLGAEACATPFCGNRKRYPPKRRPPQPQASPPTKTPTTAPQRRGFWSGRWTGDGLRNRRVLRQRPDLLHHQQQRSDTAILSTQVPGRNLPRRHQRRDVSRWRRSD